MTAPAHPVQAAATAHEQRVAGLVRWLAAADPREAPAVLRTHISTVILAGPLAYKLKRPVRLTFLDFSSLSQRRFFLEEELRINRRLAPQLYLDVLPITGSVRADQPAVNQSSSACASRSRVAAATGRDCKAIKCWTSCDSGRLGMTSFR